MDCGGKRSCSQDCIKLIDFSLSSIGWRRGPGRGGEALLDLCSPSPLPPPPPPPARGAGRGGRAAWRGRRAVGTVGGGVRAGVFIGFPSPRSSPHSFLVGRGG